MSLKESLLPIDSPDVLERRFRIALLTILKEKELGILERPEASLADELIADHAHSDWSYFKRIVDAMPVEAGLYADTAVASIEELRSLRALQGTEFWKKLTDPKNADRFDTHLWLVAACSGRLRGRDEINEELTARIERMEPTIPRLEYVLATCRRTDSAQLEEILHREPRYVSAHLRLGRVDVGSRNYVDAEAHFETVLETAPTALAALLPLAQMYFDLGEMESSRSLYERIVELAPEHRDGLLGLAQSLGYLGEHARAIEKLNRMIELGALYLGEAHYWLAWNHYQRDLPAVAREDTEKAKRYQPMDAPTFFLSGAIAATTGALDRAEVEFKQALRYDPEHCEAAVELANVYRATARERDAANQFETAGPCFAERALGYRAALEELIADTVTPSAWLQSQTDRYEKQIQDALRERARIHLEAATIYLRLGDPASATRCADVAATHPDFEERARAVVSRISR